MPMATWSRVGAVGIAPFLAVLVLHHFLNTKMQWRLFLTFLQRGRTLSLARAIKIWIVAMTAPPMMSQLTLVGTKHDPAASDRMDIAVADFIFSSALPIRLVECTKFQQLLKCARFIPPSYSPPNRKKMTSDLLVNMMENISIQAARSTLNRLLFWIASGIVRA